MRIYEINTRLHSKSFDQITDDELAEIRRLGFDAVWLMGVWQISEGVRRLSKIVSEDFEGSPYAVPDYKFNSELGGKKAFRDLAKRAHSAGLKVIVDFVSNHMAIDSKWIDGHPDFFIRSNPQARNQSTGEFFLHPSGEVIAFGRDPFFDPWRDTAQLDYSNEKLRRRMIDTLTWISRHSEGVRCDMAMLVMKDYIHQQWYPYLSQQQFDERMPSEFWAEAIAEVKKENPDFIFIAEAYWDKEQELIDLGFDLSYEKKLCDALVARNAEAVNEWITRNEGRFQNALCFIENHDEPRAAEVLNKKDNIAAAALMLSLPCSALIHEGQIEGRREKLPVQRIKPLRLEPDDQELKQAYQQILSITSQEIFAKGSFELFDSRVWGAVAFLRRYETRAVAYLGQISEAWHKFHSASFDISRLAQTLGAGRALRVTNLLNAQSTIVESREGVFHLTPEQVGISEGTEFCLIEASVEQAE